MQITVTTTRQRLLNTGQRAALQNHGPADLWIGGSDVTPANGFLVAAGATFEFPTEPIHGVGQVYGVTASGAADVRGLEL